MVASCNKAQSAAGETFAHKKRRRALKQMQEMAAEKDKGPAAEPQQPDGGPAQKSMVLPKKRALAGSQQAAAAAGASAAGAVAVGQQLAATVGQQLAATAKKQAKASGDEAVDDETLIRETEAALKSLSGGWPGPRHSFYRTAHDDDNRYESPAFVNLFDEKKIGAGSIGHPLQPAAAKVDENKNTCESRPSPQQLTAAAVVQRELVGEHNGRRPAADKYAPSKYEPDFNELVDDSSDELEIDMSADGGGGGGDCKDDDGCGADRMCRRKLDVDRRNNNSHVRADEMTSLKSESDSYDAYLMDKTSFSAFRPVSGGVEPKDSARLDLPTAVGAAMTPLGPYPPTGATFVVGYGTGLAANSNTGGGCSPTTKLSPGGGNAAGGGVGEGGGGGGGVLLPLAAGAVKPVRVKSEDDGGAETECKPDVTVKMDSPSPLSKQYTILQPAGADSRAATALQDVAREGVLGASVVSATGGGNLSPRTAAGTPKLNVLEGGGLMPPGCMNNKGKTQDSRYSSRVDINSTSRGVATTVITVC